MNEFEQVYLNILKEEKSPTTFTPESLLNDIRDRCFYSFGDFIFYTVEDLKQFADNDNKELFNIFVNNLTDKNDFGMLIIYFTSLNKLDDVLNLHGYFEPHSSSRKCPKNFKMKIVYNQIKNYFQRTKKTAGNFNSIDICPELGCVIAINGGKISSYRDFEKELDHEINHYFEKMNIHYDLKENVDNIVDVKNKIILYKLEEFYHINFSEKESYIDDLKYHLFNYDEFRSMSANVFHEILKYNEQHLKQLEFNTFIKDIENLNYINYSEQLQEIMLFCWVSKQISSSRWNILIKGIKEAISIKKNIFQKFFIKGRDIFRNLIFK